VELKPIAWNESRISRWCHSIAIVLLVLSLIFGSGLRSTFYNLVPYYVFFYGVSWGIPWILRKNISRNKGPFKGLMIIVAKSLAWLCSLAALYFVLSGLYYSLRYLHFYRMTPIFIGIAIFLGAQMALKKIDAMKGSGAI